MSSLFPQGDNLDADEETQLSVSFKMAVIVFKDQQGALFIFILVSQPRSMNKKAFGISFSYQQSTLIFGQREAFYPNILEMN